MYLRTIETAASSFKVQLTPLGVHDAAEIEASITTFAAEPDGGLIVLPHPIAAELLPSRRNAVCPPFIRIAFLPKKAV